ncbi:MAG: T9SS type A sorting domain-containing protein [Cytophagaceae bacterium]
MKRILLLFFVVTLITFTGRAQIVPNGSFEQWENFEMFLVPKAVPPTTEFQSINHRMKLRYGQIGMMPVARGEGKAMRLETKTYTKGTESQTELAYAVWGNADNGQFNGGIPFTNQGVTGLTMDLRYSINPLSPGLILVYFSKNGSAAGPGNFGEPGMYVFPVSGNQSIFTTMTFNIAPGLSMEPDHCLIAFASNNPFDDNAPVFPGDFMEVDNIKFEGATTVVPAGDFEEWEMVPPVELPAVWNLLHESSTASLKSTDKYSGEYALKLISYGSGSQARSQTIAIGNEYYIQEQDTTIIVPGMALSGKPKSIGFHYKYSRLNTDSGNVYVFLSKWDAVNNKRIAVGGSWAKLEPASDYTYFFNHINYLNTEVPDSAFIRFSASVKWPAEAGSILLIDDVRFNYCDENINISGSASFCPNAQGMAYSIVHTPGSTYSWTVPSDASIASGATSNNITVNFGSAPGIIKVTKTYIDGCDSKEFELNVSVASTPTVNAGNNAVICQTGSAALNGSVVGAAGGKWSGGTGTFLPNDETLNATYVPGAGDIGDGSENDSQRTITLTLTSTGHGSCEAESHTMTVTVQTSVEAILVSAPSAVCASNPAISLSGNSKGYSVGGGWSSAGNGQFNDPNNENTVYTPSQEEITAGEVIIYGTAEGDACPNDTKEVKIAINKVPSVSAGQDQTICGYSVTLSGVSASGHNVTWSGGANGTYTAQQSATTNYTASAADLSAGLVTFTIESTENGACAKASDNVVVTFKAPIVVNAGTGSSVCTGQNIALNGSVSGGTTTGIWTSSGNGSFSSNTDLQAAYTPSSNDIQAGQVTLTLTSTNSGCTEQTSQVTYTISVCTGTSLLDKSSVLMYPNPTKGMFTVETRSGASIEKVELLNNMQQDMGNINVEMNGASANVDLTNIESGVYFIVVTSANGRSVQKLIKQ